MPFDAATDRKLMTPRWLSYSLAALFFVGAFSLASLLFGKVIGFVVCVPLIGVFVSRLLLNHAGAGYDAMRWLALHKLNGNYHTLDDRHIRVVWLDGQCAVAASDVFKHLNEKSSAASCRRLAIAFGDSGFFQGEQGAWWFGENAALAWLNKRAHKADQNALRLKLWLEREVFPPFHKKAEIAAHLAAQPPVSTSKKP
jgi:hypothetical protein